MGPRMPGPVAQSTQGSWGSHPCFLNCRAHRSCERAGHVQRCFIQGTHVTCFKHSLLRMLSDKKELHFFGAKNVPSCLELGSHTAVHLLVNLSGRVWSFLHLTSLGSPVPALAMVDMRSSLGRAPQGEDLGPSDTVPAHHMHQWPHRGSILSTSSFFRQSSPISLLSHHSTTSHQPGPSFFIILHYDYSFVYLAKPPAPSCRIWPQAEFSDGAGPLPWENPNICSVQVQSQNPLAM